MFTVSLIEETLILHVYPKKFKKISVSQLMAKWKIGNQFQSFLAFIFLIAIKLNLQYILMFFVKNE